MYETVTIASKPWCNSLPGGPEEITLTKNCSMVTGNLNFDSRISKRTIGNMHLLVINAWLKIWENQLHCTTVSVITCTIEIRSNVHMHISMS